MVTPPYIKVMAWLKQAEFLQAVIDGLLKRAGLCLAMVGIAVGVVWAAAIAPFDAPDEPSHLLAVMQVRVRHILPEIHFDYRNNPKGEVVNTYVDPSIVEYAKSSGVRLRYSLIPIEAVQPPFYYMVAGSIASLVPSEPRYLLYACRLVSVLFGALTVFFAWAAVRQLAPNHPMLAIAVSASITLLPQFGFNMASVSNDSAVNCAGALSIYIWARSLREPAFDRWMLGAGAAAGLAVLTKMSGLVLLPCVFLVVIIRVTQQNRKGKGSSVEARKGARSSAAELLAKSAGATAGFVAVTGWWVMRNLIVYGEPTGLGEAIKYNAGKLPKLSFADAKVRSDFLVGSWQSFWGRFGWFDLTLPDWLYQQTAVVSLILVSLTLFVVFRRVLNRSHPVFTPVAQAGSVFCALLGLLAVADVAYSMVNAFQAQGRYLFLGLIPLSLLLFTGIYTLMSTGRGKALALSIILCWLGAMTLAGLLRVSA